MATDIAKLMVDDVLFESRAFANMLGFICLRAFANIGSLRPQSATIELKPVG